MSERERGPMRFAVESWSPDYGSPVGSDALEPTTAEVDASVERPVDRWAPIDPGPDTALLDDLLFVDGVRRVEAHVWITDDTGVVHQGICASYAAGAVRCDGTARLVDARVERRLLSAAPTGADIQTRHGRFGLATPVAGDPVDLSLLLQKKMGDLEARVVAEARTDEDPVPELAVVDGPLHAGHTDPGVVGYVKTHRAAYGPPVVRDTITELAVGQRTPLLLLGGIFHRYTWYQRLPCRVRHGWAGIVRLEATADQDRGAVVELADRVCRSLGRYASTEPKDPRAPQNLYPVGGLERELRRRLGDPAVLFRALRRAAADAA